MDDTITSRFIRRHDAKTSHMVFDLPPYWWSRPYEYEWASRFTRPTDVALDAACGVCHPFKFHLADVCRESHACDLDARILSPDAILADIANDFGPEVARKFSPHYLERVSFAKASLTQLPYADKTFDRIYCISVLEHLNVGDMLQSLQEFKRTLKDEGQIVITMDFPTVNLATFNLLLLRAGLRYAGPTEFDIPDDAIYSEQWKLRVFRSVLNKRP